MTNTNDYNEYQAKQEELHDIETARVRGWGYFLGAYLTGPIWPADLISAELRRSHCWPL